jgi:hypothetical protein
MADAKYGVESLKVELLLGPDSVSFEVPEFQRGYAWGAEEVTQLLDDLFHEQYAQGNTSSIDVPYFLGSLVLAKRGDSFRILDGQQRLTTISLLLIVLRAKLSEFGFEDAPGINKFLEFGKIGRIKTAKLALQPSDRGLYRKLLQDPGSHKEPEFRRRNLVRAMKRIIARLDEFASLAQSRGVDPLQTYSGMLRTLLYQVEFVSIVSPSESDAFKLFETLNDRGLALNAADLVKNKLFAQCGRDLEDAVDAWTNAVDSVGEEEIVNFLRYFWLSREGFVRKRGLYDSFRQHLEGLGNLESALFAMTIEDYAAVYRHIAHPNPETCPWGAEVGEALNRLVSYRARSCRPALLACAMTRGEDMRRLAHACESITVRYSTVGERNPNQLEQMYAEVCAQLRDSSSIEEILYGANIFEIPDDEEFQERFSGIDLNRVTKTWRVILERLNSMLGTGETRVEGADRVHVEHILPRNPDARTLKESGLTPAEAEELIGRIGNLTLLSGKKNREISNKPFSQKKSSFQSSEIGLNRWVTEQSSWGRAEIENRSKELARLALLAYPWPVA